MSNHDFRIGDLVHDRDDPDPDAAVVVNTPSATFDEWTAYTTEAGEQVTIAEDNPDYPAEAAVFVVVFRDTLAEAFPAWPDRTEPYPLDTLHEAGVSYFKFPAPRLTLVERSDADDGSTAKAGADETKPTEDGAGSLQDLQGDLAKLDGPVAMAELAARLHDANWQLEAADGVLIGTKLDETYQIYPDGTVEGEGNIRQALEHTIANYVD